MKKGINFVLVMNGLPKI